MILPGTWACRKKLFTVFSRIKIKLVCALTGKEFETQQFDLEKIAGNRIMQSGKCWASYNIYL
jgi:hypothetical protein